MENETGERFGGEGAGACSPLDLCKTTEGPLAPTTLEDAELVAGILGHSVGCPRRLHDEFDECLPNTFEPFDRCMRLAKDLRAGGAGRTGHRHLDSNAELAIFVLVDCDRVDQPKSTTLIKNSGSMTDLSASRTASSVTGMIMDLTVDPACQAEPDFSVTTNKTDANSRMASGIYITNRSISPISARRQLELRELALPSSPASTSATPVWRSNLAPCRGQVIEPPALTAPPDSGPPSCVQRSSSA